MSNELEDFMRENKAAFDRHVPNPDLWNKVYQKVKKPKKLTLKWLKYVAAIMIFSLGFTLGGVYKSKEHISDLMPLNKQQKIEKSKLLESEYYYKTKINERMNQLEPFFASDPKLKEDICMDFEGLDSFYKQLKTDLADDVDNEHVIEAMIQSYQTKLQILESLLEQLNAYHEEAKSYEI